MVISCINVVIRGFMVGGCGKMMRGGQSEMRRKRAKASLITSLANCLFDYRHFLTPILSKWRRQSKRKVLFQLSDYSFNARLWWSEQSTGGAAVILESARDVWAVHYSAAGTNCTLKVPLCTHFRNLFFFFPKSGLQLGSFTRIKIIQKNSNRSSGNSILSPVFTAYHTDAFCLGSAKKKDTFLDLPHVWIGT